MAKIRTHYDNLQVARTASDEVIRASYRTLSQKHHPDKNGNNQSTSERWIKIINEAYAVLSDPEKRSLHDEWIVRMEAAQREPSKTAHPKPDQPTQQSAENLVNPKEVSWLLYSKAAWIALIGTLVSMFDPPYIYYSYLHFIFFVVSIFGMYLIGKERHIVSFFLILIALIFNPIASVTLGGVDHNSWDLWLLLNIISLVPIFYVRHELLAMASGSRTDAWLERELLKNEPSTSSVDFTLSYRSLLFTSLLAAAAGMGAFWAAEMHNVKGLLGTAQIIVVGGAIGVAVAGLSFLSIWIYRLSTKTPDEDYRLVRQALSKKIGATLWIFSIMVTIGYLYFLPMRKASYEADIASYEATQQAATTVTAPTQAPFAQSYPVDSVAQFKLGYQYFHGQGVAQDYSQAVYWYRKAADQGNADAQNDLGFMYADGLGVPKDLKAALYYIGKSAIAGVPSAQTSLGWAYMSNYLGLPQDYQLAMKWNRVAADQGFGRGSENIGLLYEKGWGVPVNYLQAANWYKKAIAQGANSGQAQLHLGRLYENGFGVQQNLIEAVNLYRTVVEKFGNSEDAGVAKIRLDSIIDQHQSHAQNRIANEKRPESELKQASNELSTSTEATQYVSVMNELIDAVQHSNVTKVDLILGQGTDINERNGSGTTPLIEAVLENDLNMVRHLIGKGANPNLRNSSGISPLVIAKVERHPNAEMINFLTASGAINPFSQSGK